MTGLEGRLSALWRRLGVSHPDVAAVAARIVGLYDDPARAYHNRMHLAEVLAQLDWARGALDRSGELAGLDAAARARLFDTVELALFYHDAIYDAKAADNEAQSRELMRRDAAAFGLDAAVAADAARLIDLTAHHAAAARLDEKIMADCDLAILGAEVARFRAYDAGIRRECAHVPAPQPVRCAGAAFFAAALQDMDMPALTFRHYRPVYPPGCPACLYPSGLPDAGREAGGGGSRPPPPSSRHVEIPAGMRDSGAF